MAWIYRGMPGQRQLLAGTARRWLHLSAAILLALLGMPLAHAADLPLPAPYTSLQAMHHGVLFAFLLFGLLLFLHKREKPHGLYALFIALLLLHGIYVDALAPASGEQDNVLVSTASLAVAACGLFVLAWLKVYKYLSPKAWFAGAVLAGLNLVAAILAMSGLYDAAIMLALSAGAALMLLLYGASWRLAIRGMREARYAAAALTLLIAGGATACLVALDAIAATPLKLWALDMASTLAAPLLAYGLVDCRLKRVTQDLRVEREKREAEQGRARRFQAMLAVRTEELAAARREIDEMSIIDEVTGAFNRRYFDQTSTNMLARRNRDDPFAMCIFQVDNLGAFEELHGHEASDQVLRDITAAVRGELRRAGDCLFRLGSDAFGVMFTASTPERALQFAERLRAAVKGLRITHAGHPEGIVTASFGVAWWSVNMVDDLTPGQIDAEVDKLLKSVAGGGRSSVVMHAA